MLWKSISIKIAGKGVCTDTIWSMTTMSKWIRGFFSLLPLYSQVLDTLTWTLYRVFMGRSSDNGVILPCKLFTANCYYLFNLESSVNNNVAGYITCIASWIMDGKLQGLKKRNRLNQSVIVIVNVKNYYKNKKVEPYGSVL